MMVKDSLVNHSLHFEQLLIEKDALERGYEEVTYKIERYFSQVLT
jgi:hypothetical protein